jgi:hypothetical protein
MKLGTLYFIPNVRIVVKTGRNIAEKHLNEVYLQVLLNLEDSSC